MTSLTTHIKLSGWGFTPGPEQMDEPTDSQFCDDISQHPARSVAASLLAFPGVEMVHPADPSWWHWKARWHDQGRSVDLTMTLFDDLEETWGGSEVKADCMAGDLLDLWSFLRARHTGVWPHAPDCTMHTPHSFLEELAAGLEQSTPR